MISLGDTVRHQTAGWNLHSIWLLLNMCWWSGWTPVAADITCKYGCIS